MSFLQILLITQFLHTVTCVPTSAKNELRLYSSRPSPENRPRRDKVRLSDSDILFVDLQPYEQQFLSVQRSLRKLQGKSKPTVVKHPVKKNLSELCSGIITPFKRYDNETKLCGEAGATEHCGKNMKFYSLANDTVFGQCDCDYYQGVPLVYHPPHKRCYFVYQQGYCKASEWVVLNPQNGKGVCSPNSCYNAGRTKFGSPPLASRDRKPEYVPLNGNGACVLLNKESVMCGQDETVRFKWPSKNVFPKCSPLSQELDEGIFSKTISVPSVKCPPGSYRTVFGICQTTFDFD